MGRDGARRGRRKTPNSEAVSESLARFRRAPLSSGAARWSYCSIMRAIPLPPSLAHPGSLSEPAHSPCFAPSLCHRLARSWRRVQKVKSSTLIHEKAPSRELEKDKPREREPTEKNDLPKSPSPKNKPVPKDRSLALGLSQLPDSPPSPRRAPPPLRTMSKPLTTARLFLASSRPSASTSSCGKGKFAERCLGEASRERAVGTGEWVWVVMRVLCGCGRGGGEGGREKQELFEEVGRLARVPRGSLHAEWEGAEEWIGMEGERWRRLKRRAQEERSRLAVRIVAQRPLLRSISTIRVSLRADRGQGGEGSCVVRAFRCLRSGAPTAWCAASCSSGLEHFQLLRLSDGTWLARVDMDTVRPTEG